MSEQPAFASMAGCSSPPGFSASSAGSRWLSKLQACLTRLGHPPVLYHSALYQWPGCREPHRPSHTPYPTTEEYKSTSATTCPHTAIQRELNLYLENVNGITHGEPYNFIISRSFCSLHRFHEGPSALMALE